MASNFQIGSSLGDSYSSFVQQLGQLHNSHLHANVHEGGA